MALANKSRDEGIYEEDLFRERLTEIITAHDLDDPMFLVCKSLGMILDHDY